MAMVTFSHYPADPRPRRAAEALVKEGMQVDLVCLADGESPKREVLNGINVFRIPVRHRRGGKLSYAYEYSVFILISSITQALRALTHGYDLVYVHNMPDILVLSSLIPKMLGAKVVLDLHDPMPELMMTIFKLNQNSSNVRLLTQVEKWSIARANVVVTPNIAFKRIFSARSCSPEKIGVVMNSPDTDIFPFRKAGPCASLKDPTRPFVMMYHGSLVERNGLDLAVEALAKVRAVIPTAELRVYGRSTPFLERVMAEARNQGLDACLKYLGSKSLEELVREIESCDVGIIPNQRNAFTDINMPTRIFEYLALGKPVIAPRTAGIQDYFSEDSLFFFESGDANELARKMHFVFSHPIESVETTKRGQQVYLTHTWPHERQVLVGLLSQLF